MMGSILISTRRIPHWVTFGDFNQQRLLFDYGKNKWLRLDEVGVMKVRICR